MPPPIEPPEPDAHPALAAAWAALDEAAVDWAVLRGSGLGDEDEADLLVRPRDLARATTALAGAAFARIPAIGHGRHRFHRTYHGPTDRWLTIDVVDALGFGPGGALGLDGVVDPMLDRRRRSPVPARLDPDDGFWALLLHDLLDRRDTPAAHRAQVAAFAASARADGPLGSAIDRLGSPGAAAGLIERVRAGDEIGARRLGHALGRAWRRRSLIAVTRRRLAQAVLRRLRKPHTALRRRGIDVAVLGPDGAGKSSVAAALVATLPIPTRTVYLGLYAAGLEGSGRAAFGRRLARLWRGWLAGGWHRLRGRIVVYDRHALDSALRSRTGSRRRRIRRAVLAHAIPAPALIVVLDAPGEILHERSGEHDADTLETQRHGYLELATRRRNVVVVDATGDADGVRRAVTSRIWERYRDGIARG